MALDLSNLPPERIADPASRRAWPHTTLPRLLAARAASHPTLVAVDDGERSVRLHEFLDDVQAVARGLQQRGVRPGDVVAYQLPTHYDTVLLHYAIAFAGAVGSPISLLHRAHDLRHMLRLVEPKLVVVRPEYRDVDYQGMVTRVVQEIGLAAAEVLAVPSGQLPAMLAREGSTPLPRVEDPNQPLYIVWTSGTTGEPKGVIHTHNTGLCGLGLKLQRLGVGAGDAMLIITPVTHHIGIYGMHMLALAEIRLVLMETWHADRAVELIERLRPTFTSGPPTFLVDLVRCETLPRHDVSTLRIFSCGGAPVPPSIVALGTKMLPDCRILSSYGTSEEGYVTSVAPDDAVELSTISDGRPLEEMEVRILGPDKQDLGPGEAGDLIVRTPSCFVGYARLPEVTRTSFIFPGWRWTGDQAMLRPDGTVRLTGRSKDMIIRGGINLPVPQIESVLLTHPAVGSVAVVAMPDARLGEKACAYVVPRSDARPTLDDLNAFLLAEGVSPTFRPERLELVDALPMTASGKVQKFRLREMIAKVLEAEGG